MIMLGFFMHFQNLIMSILYLFLTKTLHKNLKKDDYRLSFIKEQIKLMNEKLKKYECSINIFYGKPLDVFKKIISKTKNRKVVINKDYEPYAIKRDDAIKE